MVQRCPPTGRTTPCVVVGVTAAVLPGRLLDEAVGHPVGVDTGLEADEDVHTATYTGSDDARYADVHAS